MRTLGIDLASQDVKTASCAIEWSSARAVVELPRMRRPESELLSAMERADWIGIDAPFGWPDAMVAAIHGYAHGESWPPDAVPEKLRYRETDRFIHDVVAEQRETSVWPLSVSSDRIAVCAWRCASLLTQYAARTGWKLDRIGVPSTIGMDDSAAKPRASGLVAQGSVVEVYPAAALAVWGLPHTGYKANRSLNASQARQKRISTMAELQRLAGVGLILSEDVREACLVNDDAFDAFIASLVARSAAIGRTLTPLAEQRDAAQREGWIHLPSPDSIQTLALSAS